MVCTISGTTKKLSIDAKFLDMCIKVNDHVLMSINCDVLRKRIREDDVKVKTRRTALAVCAALFIGTLFLLLSQLSSLSGNKRLLLLVASCLSGFGTFASAVSLVYAQRGLIISKTNAGRHKC